ncbi:hypothetical protein QBC35DRAFT_536671 [Podospora australis]|uniref:Uncharacterized protein n=1 Tax=Podospora australis TaxID=1536484 RepID=A0AAN6WHZ9_9PEZI|nr:hypothetical protein QBC35DRAFT_536671 [Podospora australis]
MDDQLPTLKTMVWDRLNSLAVLRRLSRHAKQTIADRVVQITQASKTHRSIFLTSARYIGESGSDNMDQDAQMREYGESGSDSVVKDAAQLKEYAVTNVLKHILRFDPVDLDTGEILEVLEEIAGLLSNKYKFASDLQEFKVPLADLFSKRWFSALKGWYYAFTEGRDKFKQPSGSNRAMDTEAFAWWDALTSKTLRRRLLLDLAKFHLRELDSSRGRIEALISYRAAIYLLGVSHYGGDLARQAQEEFHERIGRVVGGGRTILRRSEAALGIGLALDDVRPEGIAYRAVAEILLHYGRFDRAQEACNKSLPAQPANAPVETLELLARILLSKKEFPQALEKQVSKHQGSSIGYYARRNPRRGSEFGFRARGRLRTVFGILQAFTPSDRVTWMTWEWWLQGNEKNDKLQRIAVQSKQIRDKVATWYEEMLRYLDDVNAGAPLRYHLAKFHLRTPRDFEATRDRKATRAVLDEILDSGLRGDSGCYKLTNEDPSRTLHKAILLQTDVLFQLFWVETDPVRKAKLLQDVQALSLRRLAREVSLFSNTALLRHRLVVTRMVRKMGPASEFRRLLDAIFTDTCASLTDKVAWNDSTALAVFGSALALLEEAVPSMKLELLETARIMVSARLERNLDNHASPDVEIIHVMMGLVPMAMKTKSLGDTTTRRI